MPLQCNTAYRCEGGRFRAPTLPDAAFATGNARRRTPFGRRQAPGEAALYQAPTGGEGHVAGQQFNDAMQVIGQNQSAVDGEWMRTPRLAQTGPQRGDVLRQKCSTTPSQRVDREEMRPVWVPGVSLVGHGVAWQECGAMRCAFYAGWNGGLSLTLFQLERGTLYLALQRPEPIHLSSACRP